MNKKVESEAEFSDSECIPTHSEINRMSHLLKKIEKSRLELAKIQNYYPTCSINYVCESASYIVKKTLGEEIMWTN